MDLTLLLEGAKVPSDSNGLVIHMHTQTHFRVNLLIFTPLVEASKKKKKKNPVLIRIFIPLIKE